MSARRLERLNGHAVKIGPLGEIEFERARRHLMRVDPRFRPIMQRVGRCRLPEARTRAPFASSVVRRGTSMRSNGSAGIRAAGPRSCRTNVMPANSAAGQNSTRMSRPLK